MLLTEDCVRKQAGEILGLSNSKAAVSGTGQLTTFNQLGQMLNDSIWKGILDKPDGWYLPKDKSEVALILETKNSNVDISGNSAAYYEIQKNCRIALDRYDYIIGILYNGSDIRIFKSNGKTMDEVPNVASLQSKNYYINYFKEKKINVHQIYLLTKQINDALHIKFGIDNLYQRMIFTASALVAKRYGAMLVKGMSYPAMQSEIKSVLNKSLEHDKMQNSKLDLLTTVFDEIKMNISDNQESIDLFIKNITKISDSLNSRNWNGEDVMAIFFNEFNRYKGKSERGQVFTPDHITSLMYRIINVNQDSVVLDAACGSGAFLTKAMANMIKEAGGMETSKATEIKKRQLYGIEKDKTIFALACANMMIHKDGKTNLTQEDTTSQKAKKWIKNISQKRWPVDDVCKKEFYPVNKVLMNPPFEKKYGCLKIVKAVLDNVPMGTDAAFILPDKKLENDSKTLVKSIFKKHSLKKIIKLPEKTFEGVSASIFIFKVGEPQKDKLTENYKEIFTCYIKDDGLETVKNQGRQDIHGKWKNIENHWVTIINRQAGNDTCHWITPDLENMMNLSYPIPKKILNLTEDDFARTIMNRMLAADKIDQKVFKENIASQIMYGISENSISYTKNVQVVNANTQQLMKINMSSWSDVPISNLFDIHPTKHYNLTNKDLMEKDGVNPVIVNSAYNEGVGGYTNKDTTEKGNIITFSDTTDANAIFYQDKSFVGYSHVQGMYPKFSHVTENTMLFIATVFRKEALTMGFSYGNKFRRTIAKKMVLKLPTTSNGKELDYDFMDDFINEIKSISTKRLRLFKNIDNL